MSAKNEQFNHVSLFNGIGGFCLAAQWMGWSNIATCEIDPFCNKVSKYHFPNAIQHEDIKTTDFTIYRGRVDILTGGFPCQPYSQAGKREGTADARHLWPEMLRAVREIQPTYIVGENVPGIVNWNEGLVFEQVCADLESEGYEVQPVILPACAVNAPHRRDRVWFIAYRSGGRWRQSESRQSNEFAAQGLTGESATHTTSQRIDGIDGINNESEGTDGNRHDEFNGSSHQPTAPRTYDWGRTEDQAEWKGLGHLFEAVGVVTNPDSGIIGAIRGGETHLRREYSAHTNNSNIGGNGNATNTECTGFQESEQGEQHDNSFDAERNNSQDATDTSGGRWVQNDIKQQTAKSKHVIPGWNNFPTQSPLRGRNDGFSNLLDYNAVFDGIERPRKPITYAKWRAESIKAMGNAIVPQIAYRIFKAIEQTL